MTFLPKTENNLIYSSHLPHVTDLKKLYNVYSIKKKVNIHSPGYYASNLEAQAILGERT